MLEFTPTILDDYSGFVGQGTVLVLDTGTSIHAVRIDPPDRIGTAQALTRARDVERFEVILNGLLWHVDAPMIICPKCETAGCVACHQRGVVPTESQAVLQIVTAERGQLRCTVMYVDSATRQPTTVTDHKTASGPVMDLIWQLAAPHRKRHKLRLADLLAVWTAEGMGEVLR